METHSNVHRDNEFHHHHSHGATTHHAGDHHLLQVEGLTVAFRMYDDEAPSDGEKADEGTASTADSPRADGPISRLARGAKRFFGARQRAVPVVHDLHVSVHGGEIVAVVGASGSGKTLLADAIMGLYEPNAYVTGTVYFDGELQDAQTLAALRGHGISLVPQSVSSLDPLMRVGRQVRGFAAGGDDAARAARQRELFARYGLGPEVERLYPFELSGGMARRVLLCCALMDEPKLIIADEPTPGLDLALARAALADFREFADAGGGVLLITHDIELALSVADRVAVFLDGTVVEETSVESFRSPDLLRHPFSRQLWHALPEHDFAVVEEEACGVPQPGGEEAARAASL